MRSGVGCRDIAKEVPKRGALFRDLLRESQRQFLAAVMADFHQPLLIAAEAVSATCNCSKLFPEMRHECISSGRQKDIFCKLHAKADAQTSSVYAALLGEPQGCASDCQQHAWPETD